MPLKLSDPVVKGLQHLGTEINLDIAKKLIGNTLKHILSSESSVPSVPDIYATNADKVKLSEYAVVTILSLAIKHSCDPSEFRAIMDKYDIQPIVLEELARIYEEHRRELTLHQLHIGSDFPHITDVQWRIMADVRSSTSDCSSGEVSFHVNLGRFHETTGDRETVVEFVCSTEEMQSLINKLKEIERHCEKVASE
ncbi:COMM domain-containing protein 3 [Rhagoletis pomonella]|uniref:COMM domain-containing protein 3 n=1 Tax=Rhagoletis pomonella TaxID=28610 RepID=UPI00178421E7|nr:COMM domain-containing protein 3 [Rhagoletis pomonella]